MGYAKNKMIEDHNNTFGCVFLDTTLTEKKHYCKKCNHEPDGENCLLKCYPYLYRRLLNGGY